MQINNTNNNNIAFKAKFLYIGKDTINIKNALNEMNVISINAKTFSPNDTFSVARIINKDGIENINFSYYKNTNYLASQAENFKVIDKKINKYVTDDGDQNQNFGDLIVGRFKEFVETISK